MLRQTGGPFVELEFELTDDRYPVVRLSRDLDCDLELLDTVRSADEEVGTITEFFRVEDGSAREIVETAVESAYGTEVTVIDQFGDEFLVEVELEKSVIATLANSRVLTQSCVVRDGTARIVAVLPPGRDPAAVTRLVTEHHPSVRLAAKRQRSVPISFGTVTALQSLLEDYLTDQQRRALELAAHSGYFERPRRTSQQKLGEEMGISPSTYGQHLNTALQKLLALFVVDGVASTDDVSAPIDED